MYRFCRIKKHTLRHYEQIGFFTIGCCKFSLFLLRVDKEIIYEMEMAKVSILFQIWIMDILRINSETFWYNWNYQ